MELLTFIVVILCLGFSAFFSASETAITGISKSYLLSQTQKGNTRAKLLSDLLKQPDNIITTLLIGNNVANIFFTTIVTSYVITHFGTGYTIVTGLSITLVILALAEILPKTYAFSNPNHVAIATSPIVFVIIVLLYPLSLLFLYLNRLFLKLVRHKHKSNSFGSVDNLRGAIEMLEREEESNNITSQEKEMLHSILDLNDLTVSSIMKHRKNVFCIDIDDPTESIINKAINSAYTRIPVFRDRPDNIIGIINVKDVFKAYKQTNGKSIEIKKLTAKPYFIPESTYVIDLLMVFRDKHERIALIVDEYGSFMGILTLGDILEEITGELRNFEQIQQNEYIHKIGDSYIVDGDYKIRDLNRKMFWKLPDEEFTTVAGLILYETGKIPNVSNVFVFHNFKFEILEKKRHQLVKIKITPLQEGQK